MRKYKTDIEDKLRNRTKPIIVKPEKPIPENFYDRLLDFDEMVRTRIRNESRYQESKYWKYLEDYKLC